MIQGPASANCWKHSGTIPLDQLQILNIKDIPCFLALASGWDRVTDLNQVTLGASSVCLPCRRTFLVSQYMAESPMNCPWLVKISATGNLLYLDGIYIVFTLEFSGIAHVRNSEDSRGCHNHKQNKQTKILASHTGLSPKERSWEINCNPEKRAFHVPLGITSRHAFTFNHSSRHRVKGSDSSFLVVVILWNISFT